MTCMAVVLYREKVRKVIRVKKAETKVSVNVLPFMPFYDTLCPLALYTEKVTKVRYYALPFMTFYDPFALWYSTMKCHNVTMSHCHRGCRHVTTHHPL